MTRLIAIACIAAALPAWAGPIHLPHVAPVTNASAASQALIPVKPMQVDAPTFGTVGQVVTTVATAPAFGTAGQVVPMVATVPVFVPLREVSAPLTVDAVRLAYARLIGVSAEDTDLLIVPIVI